MPGLTGRVCQQVTSACLRRPRYHTRCIGQYRCLSTTPVLGTDGVFRALTENRVQTPWIDALRAQQQQHTDTQKKVGDGPISSSASERDLRPKRMRDSFHKVILPLGQDKWLLDTYLNSTGHLRLGTIFMDLDALSGVIAYKHTGDSVTTVTAACDRIVINNSLTEICDLEYSGMVTYATGRSSMEISLQVAKASPRYSHEATYTDTTTTDPKDIFLTCHFTMVSLDKHTHKPVSIPPVQPETDEERRLFSDGEKNSKHRKSLLSRSLLQHTPDDQESDLIHSLWQRQLRWHDPNDQLRKPPNVSFMDTTRLSTAAIMQPQYRNRHHFMIFGGFLLKSTFELAFCCAASFAHSRPTFVSLDPSTFQNPVPVGSVLYLTATVVYCDPALEDAEETEQKSGDGSIANQAGTKTAQPSTRVQVRVDSKVRNVEHGETKPTGQFNYTFAVERDVKIMPRTYSEFMMYVDARRRARKVDQIVASGDTDSGVDGVKERVTE